ncbi:MAG: single-stranded-DNA-specific exonuclease RecJ [Coriobacteriaceae bacterium]|nr:single-stranded-DNA-specific exonuclease RecJ [Coriobacteriaceae bacterium]
MPRFIANTLVARGVASVDEAKRFLEPSLERDWLDPYLIPGLSDVADVIEASLKAGSHILVFGDFDLDGISSTATLTRALRVLGARVTPFIPLRFEEGYGLTEASLERVFELNPDLVVTVDCGIAAKYEAKLIQQAGIALAVTDHHEPADLVPQGVPVADPKLDSDCRSSALAGVGVALKLVQVLGGRLGKPHLWREYTDLAALGTVADLMPMRSENRALVAHGIARINLDPRPCIAALLETAGVADKEVSATGLSFSLVPRLNAAGRMGDARLALDLLLTDDREEARQRAARLEVVNDKRRTIEAELSDIAKAQASELYAGERVLVVSGEGWHEGVKGIVASRLVNTYGVPALLFTIEGSEARGSGRSVGQVNLFKAVESLSDLLIRFGGHEAAVGVTLPTEKLPEFTARLAAYMEGLPAASFRPRMSVDALADLEELTLENVACLQRLAPFGQENPTPCFLARDIMLTNTRAVGTDKNHLSCVLSDGRNQIPGIMFHCADIETLTQCTSLVNAAFELQIDEWRTKRTVKAMLVSLGPAQACAGLEACLDPESQSFVASLYSADEECRFNSAAEQNREDAAQKALLAKNRAFWEEQAQCNPHQVIEQVIEAMIGQSGLHSSQQEVLDLLALGESVLAVMPTGRGKSLIFHVHAACEALVGGKASLFIYPLRALIADQAFHIGEALEAFGIAAAVLTGETPREERERIFAELAQGACDIVLTTPEFLDYHIRRFAACRRIGFVVVDEAHHIAQAKAGQRGSYARLGSLVENLAAAQEGLAAAQEGLTLPQENLTAAQEGLALPQEGLAAPPKSLAAPSEGLAALPNGLVSPVSARPVVLALTATADTETAEAITSTLGIDHRVCDRICRTNLAIDDQRNLKDRESYLACLIAGGEKTVIYVNSREQSLNLARSLRKLVPQMASLIGFYNAGLTRRERKRIEEFFRNGTLCVLVATSAFGEGINIPDIRHVVLYHLPFNEIEFNQMSGRAGRDGSPAVIHALFGRTDAAINEQILADMTPGHDCLAQVYRRLKRHQQERTEEFFAMGNDELAALASREGRFTVSAASAACAVAVFRELGLIETRSTFNAGKAQRLIRVCEAKSKVALTDSIRYGEGLGEREAFLAFRDWAIRSAPEALRMRIAQAILPDEDI